MGRSHTKAHRGNYPYEDHLIINRVGSIFVMPITEVPKLIKDLQKLYNRIEREAKRKQEGKE